MIRELAEGDAAVIGATQASGAWHGGEAKWRTYFDEQRRGLRVCLLAVEDGEIHGYGSLVWRSQHPPFAEAGIPEVQDMVVGEAWRRRGLAARLLAAFEARARAAGYATLGIGFGLYADYGAAQRLYVRSGYVPDGGGITHDNAPVVPGAMVRVDDDLVLWLTKSL